jgi:hypothetical protein
MAGVFTDTATAEATLVAGSRVIGNSRVIGEVTDEQVIHSSREELNAQG